MHGHALPLRDIGAEKGSRRTIAVTPSDGLCVAR